MIYVAICVIVSDICTCYFFVQDDSTGVFQCLKKATTWCSDSEYLGTLCLLV